MRAEFERALTRLELDPEGGAPELLSRRVGRNSDARAGWRRSWPRPGVALRRLRRGRTLLPQQGMGGRRPSDRSSHYRRSAWPTSTCLGQLCAALYYGPAPARDAIARCKELLADADPGRAGTAQFSGISPGSSPWSVSSTQPAPTPNDAREIFDDLGQKGAAVHTRAVLGDIELLAGDAEAARRQYETLCRFCEENGELGLLSTYAADLAEVASRARRRRGSRALEPHFRGTRGERRRRRTVRLAGGSGKGPGAAR